MDAFTHLGQQFDALSTADSVSVISEVAPYRGNGRVSGDVPAARRRRRRDEESLVGGGFEDEYDDDQSTIDGTLSLASVPVNGPGHVRRSGEDDEEEEEEEEEEEKLPEHACA